MNIGFGKGEIIDHAPHGATLFVCRATWYYVVTALIGGPVFLSIAVFVPADRLAFALRLLILLAGIGLVAIGIRAIRNGPVLFEVTERGIQVYANADGIAVAPTLLKNLFIPWERIEYMTYMGLKAVRAADLWPIGRIRGTVTQPLIVIKARMDPFWPPWRPCGTIW